VRAHILLPPKLGDRLEFRLLKRERNDIIAQEVKEPAPAGNSQYRGGDSTAAASKGVQPSACQGSVLESLQYNRFAKFTQVEDAPLLWTEAAEQLANYASEVTAEGGRDAAQEAPFIYAAIDQLANRAASWAERRQRLLHEQGIESVMPRDAALAAAAAVKEITNARVTSVDDARRQAAQERTQEAAEHHRMSSFPSLAPETSRPPLHVPSHSWGTHAAASKTQNVEAAFSDEEDLHQMLASSPEANGAQEAALGSKASPAEVSNGNSNAPPAEGQAGEVSIAPGSSLQPPASEFYFYQSMDGRWLFLHPLLMRVLLTHHCSYSGLPASIHGTLVEVEPQMQTPALRKRHKFLGHLPLGGGYALAEIDLREEVGEAGLVTFSSELANRAERREGRVKEQQLQEARDARKAAALQKVSAGPSAAELKAMPLPGQQMVVGRSESEDLQEAVALSLAGHPKQLEDTPAPAQPPEAGISFAHMARMGYAATGPALSSTPPSKSVGVWGPSLGSSLPVHEPGSFPPRSVARGAWGSGAASGAGSRVEESKEAVPDEPQILEASGGRGKKKKALVLRFG